MIHELKLLTEYQGLLRYYLNEGRPIPVAVRAELVMRLADLLCCLPQLQLVAEINWLDTPPMEHRNTEVEPLRDLNPHNQTKTKCQ